MQLSNEQRLNIFISMIGNPLAFWAVLWSGVQGSFLHKGGVQEMTGLGMMLLFLFGLFYIATLSFIRSAIRREQFIKSVISVTQPLGRASYIGLLMPFIFFCGMEMNVFGFIFFLPYCIYILVFAFCSFYSLCSESVFVETKPEPVLQETTPVNPTSSKSKSSEPNSGLPPID